MRRGLAASAGVKAATFFTNASMASMAGGSDPGNEHPAEAVADDTTAANGPGPSGMVNVPGSGQSTPMVTSVSV
jgi:hypothetical protein